MSTISLVINGVLFQLVWFLSIFLKLEMAVVALFFMLLHVISKLINKHGVFISVLAFCMGVTMDAVLHYSGVYEFPIQHELDYFYLPSWLLMIWVGFSLALPYSLHWMFKNRLLFIGLMSVLAPVSYLAGREFGMIEFTNGQLIYVVLAWSIWSFLLMLLFTLFNKRYCK